MPLTESDRKRVLNQLRRALALVEQADMRAFETQIEFDHGADAQLYDMVTFCLACLHSVRDAAQLHRGDKYAAWLQEQPSPEFIEDLDGLIWLRNLQHHAVKKVYDVVFDVPTKKSHTTWTARASLPQHKVGDILSKAVFERAAKNYDDQVASDYLLRPLWRASYLLQDRLGLGSLDIIQANNIEYLATTAPDNKEFFRENLRLQRGRDAFMRRPTEPLDQS